MHRQVNNYKIPIKYQMSNIQKQKEYRRSFVSRYGLGWEGVPPNDKARCSKKEEENEVAHQRDRDLRKAMQSKYELGNTVLSNFRKNE